MLLERAGAAGHEESRLVLATMMLQGDGGAPAPPRALGILDELVTGARSEDVRAQAHAVLGDCHARGVGVEADETTAFHHYEQAAECCVPQCAFNIALAYDWQRMRFTVGPSESVPHISRGIDAEGCS